MVPHTKYTGRRHQSGAGPQMIFSCVSMLVGIHIFTTMIGTLTAIVGAVDQVGPASDS